MSMNVQEYYTEASSCLELLAAECGKKCGVDLNFMFDTCSRCQDLLKELKLIDEDSTRQLALDQLLQMVDYYMSTLSAKTCQLEEDCPSSGEHSHCSSTSHSSDGTQHKPANTTKDNSVVTGRRLAIEDTIIQKGSLRFEDVAGLKDAKQALKEAIIIPLQYPQLFTGGRKPWRRILLYGPPGTGKSRLAQAISAEIQSAFYCVSSSDLVSSWVGESEKLIKELFAHATSQKGRSVIFIDEIDSISRKRNSREEEHTRRIKTELLKQMEGADNSEKQDRIFLLCATNCPWELDSAFLRRFQKRIYIPLPDRSARVSLMKIHCADQPVNLTDHDWERLSDATENYSGSDIANIVLEAMFQPVRTMQQAQYWNRTPDNKFVPCDENDPGAFQTSLTQLPPDEVSTCEVCLEDFLSSLATHHHTVTREELDKFTQFTQNFGQNG